MSFDVHIVADVFLVKKFKEAMPHFEGHIRPYSAIFSHIQPYSAIFGHLLARAVTYQPHFVSCQQHK